MTREIRAAPLTEGAFAPFGDVLEARGTPDKLINLGLCGRFHDRARLDFGADTSPPGRAGISIFHAEPRALPCALEMLERHPEGSQAFIPMTQNPFLVIVSQTPDAAPLAFVTNGAQGINLHRGIWHGVLTPLAAPGLFAVIDRIGQSPNLEEYWFNDPWLVTNP